MAQPEIPDAPKTRAWLSTGKRPIFCVAVGVLNKIPRRGWNVKARQKVWRAEIHQPEVWEPSCHFLLSTTQPTQAESTRRELEVLSVGYPHPWRTKSFPRRKPRIPAALPCLKRSRGLPLMGIKVTRKVASTGFSKHSRRKYVTQASPEINYGS